MVAIRHDIIFNFKANVRGFNKGMRETGIEFRKHSDKLGHLIKGQKKASNAGQRWALQIRKMTHGFRGFRMEMLGVMFFGMGLQKFFTGLLKPAMKLTGLTELLSNVLAVLFLPIVLKIIDFLIPWIDKIMNLSDETKVFIGKIVLWGAAIGGILFLVGMFALGIGSLIMAFGSLISIIAIPLIAVFTILGTIMHSLPRWGAAIIAVLLGFGIVIPGVTAVGSEMKKSGGIWKMIGDKISGIISGVIAKLDEWWEKIIESDFIRPKLEALGIDIEKLKNPIKTVGDMISGAWDGFLRKHPELIKKMGDIGLTAGEILKPWEHLDTIIPKIIDAIFDKIKTRVDEMWASFDKRFPEISTLINDLIEPLQRMVDILEDIQERGLFKFLFRPDPGPTLAEDVSQAVKDFVTGKKHIITGEPGKMAGGQFGIPVVPHTGLYKLHAGETVTPAGDTFNSSPTINVFGVGAEDIARQVSEMVTRDLASLARR